MIDDSYCETIWQYDLPANLHGLGMGSVQLLENGNYFNESEWKQMNKFANETFVDESDELKKNLLELD